MGSQPNIQSSSSRTKTALATAGCRHSDLRFRPSPWKFRICTASVICRASGLENAPVCCILNWTCWDWWTLIQCSHINEEVDFFWKASRCSLGFSFPALFRNRGSQSRFFSSRDSTVPNRDWQQWLWIIIAIEIAKINGTGDWNNHLCHYFLQFQLQLWFNQIEVRTVVEFPCCGALTADALWWYNQFQTSPKNPIIFLYEPAEISLIIRFITIHKIFQHSHRFVSWLACRSVY